MQQLTLNNLTAFAAVFTRMGAMVFLNPVFSRRNVPSQVRAGLALFLTILLVGMVDTSPLENLAALSFVVILFRELLVGVACSCVFQSFYYILFFAGDLMDFQFGLSMAKVFDPGTSIQMSISGNIFSLLFVLFLFVTDSHLVLIRLFASSYELVPVGGALATGSVSPFMITLFESVFSLAFRLALPFIAAEFVVEVAMGILMKLIPQVHVFVVNIQFKLLLGIFLLFAFSQPIADFIDNYLQAAMQSMQKLLTVLTK